LTDDVSTRAIEQPAAIATRFPSAILNPTMGEAERGPHSLFRNRRRAVRSHISAHISGSLCHGRRVGRDPAGVAVGPSRLNPTHLHITCMLVAPATGFVYSCLCLCLVHIRRF
jgi:hypothetical protein